MLVPAPPEATSDLAARVQTSWDAVVRQSLDAAARAEQSWTAIQAADADARARAEQSWTAIQAAGRAVAMQLSAVG